MSATTLFDVAGIRWRPSRYGGASLECPHCRRWSSHLIITDQAAVICRRCWLARVTPLVVEMTR